MMPDEMIPFVSNDAAGYEVFMGRWTNRLAGPFLEFAGVGRGQRVLDVGCGTGVITCASFERGGVHHIGHPDAAFDAVVCRHWRST